jgi:branched-chain amino acid transport system substrate-binding protein
MLRKKARNYAACALAALAVGTSALAASAQEVRVGISMALTGTYAFVGVPINNGILLGLEEAQSSGVLGPVKLVWTVEDSGSEKAQAITAVNRFATRDRMQLILGPTSSIEGAAAAPVANDLQIPMLSSALSEVVTNAGKWSFKVTAAPTTVMPILAKYAVEKLKLKSAVLVFTRDNEGYVSQKNTMKNAFGTSVNILAEESVVGSDSDFQAMVTKIISLKPDGLFIASTPEIGANIIRQAKQAGLPDSTKLLGVSTMATPQFIKLGGSTVEGTVFVTDYFAGNPSEANKKFVDAYTKKYGSVPENWGAVGYTLAQMAVAAIKSAGPAPDREKIRDALAKTQDLPVVLGNGRLNLDANRNPFYGAVSLTVRNGELALVE